MNYREVFVTAIGLMFVFVFWRIQDQRRRHVLARAGEAVLEIGRPLLRTPYLWASLSFPLAITAKALLDWPDLHDWRFLPNLALLFLAALQATAIVLRAGRGERTIDAVMTKNGVLVETGAQYENDYIPWTAVERWTWSRTPRLQLNLYDGRAVRCIPVEATAHDEVERVLQASVAR